METEFGSEGGHDKWFGGSVLGGIYGKSAYRQNP